MYLIATEKVAEVIEPMVGMNMEAVDITDDWLEMTEEEDDMTEEVIGMNKEVLDMAEGDYLSTHNERNFFNELKKINQTYVLLQKYLN